MGGFAGLFRRISTRSSSSTLIGIRYWPRVPTVSEQGEAGGELESYDTVGIDCVAMNINDLIVGVPSRFSSSTISV